MIQTKEELFLAELGINTKEEIELTYGAKIKITDLLKKYEAKQLLIHSVVVLKGTVCNHEWTQWKAEGETLDGCTKCGLIEKQTAL